MAFKSSGFIASQEKFLIVMETYTMSEMELNKYCREKGLYVEKVKKWRISCLSANCTEDISIKKLNQELQENKKKIKVLETELARKEKVLAEITALLKLSPTFTTFTPKNTISSL
jgi:transposase